MASQRRILAHKNTRLSFRAEKPNMKHSNTDLKKKKKKKRSLHRFQPECYLKPRKDPLYQAPLILSSSPPAEGLLYDIVLDWWRALESYGRREEKGKKSNGGGCADIDPDTSGLTFVSLRVMQASDFVCRLGCRGNSKGLKRIKEERWVHQTTTTTAAFLPGSVVRKGPSAFWSWQRALSWIQTCVFFLPFFDRSWFAGKPRRRRMVALCVCINACVSPVTLV